ncbi:MAG: hypothetical protein ABIP02_01930 [Arenimonas sp.]
MDFTLLIPITLFICIVASIKIIAESRLRRRLSETHATDDLVKAMLLADEQNRRMSALKWGLVLTLIGLSFGLIDLLHLTPEDPASWGFLIGSAGLGMIGFHLIESRKR